MEKKNCVISAPATIGQKNIRNFSTINSFQQLLIFSETFVFDLFSSPKSPYSLSERSK